MLSNLSLEKGILNAVELVIAARSLGLNLRLAFAGPIARGQSQDVIAFAAETLGENFINFGPVRNDAKAEFLALLDVFVFPTSYRFEAQPVVLIEAMSFGIPVIAKERGYIRELVGGGGAVFGEGDFDSLALNLLRQWCEMPNMLASARAQSRLRFSEIQAEANQQLTDVLSMFRDGPSNLHR